ncbi:MAG: glutamate mutase L [Bacillota bacterium]
MQLEQHDYLIIVTDVGSTTTKALLIAGQGETYRLVAAADAPTTVEAPDEDVNIGVRNAIRRLEERTGLAFLDQEGNLRKRSQGGCLDLFLSTSSAGGGLQMLVVGLVKTMTTESAQRAALGAGAVVLDALAQDDGREPFERVERMRQLRPDMILLAGGIEGGAVREVAVLAEQIALAEPQARLGKEFRVPLIYAGNSYLRPYMEHIVAGKMDLRLVDNLRPDLDRENLDPTRQAIQELFMEHVMAHAPGYAGLKAQVEADLLPTPTAVGKIMQLLAEQRKINVMGMDIGGATTDIFSVIHGHFYRTVSANLGVSYSALNVLATAGAAEIERWVPFAIDEGELRDWIHNKMLRPTTLPQTRPALAVEQALAREALRYAFYQHQDLATALRGVKPEAAPLKSFLDNWGKRTVFTMADIDLLVGSGGVISHAPQRAQAAAMMLDAFMPEGVTELAVDSIFMMPHLGVLSGTNPQAAAQLLTEECLVPLGTCIAPTGRARDGEGIGQLTIRYRDGRSEQLALSFGEIVCLPLPPGEEAQVSIRSSWKMDFGAGRWRTLDRSVRGGHLGVILDLRGRPLQLPDDPNRRREKLVRWSDALAAGERASSGVKHHV